MKICKACGINKHNDQFSKSKQTKSRLQTNCKKCHKKYMRTYNKKRYMPHPRKRAQKKPYIFRTEKECSRCHKMKDISNYHYNITAADGHQTICKKCKSNYSRKKRIKDLKGTIVKHRKPKPAMYSFEKFCPNCNKVLSKEEFGGNKSKKDGLQTYCKPCANLKAAEYFRALRKQPEHEIEYKIPVTIIKQKPTPSPKEQHAINKQERIWANKAFCNAMEEKTIWEKVKLLFK